MPADPGALAYIGVGSNLDGPEGQVRLAIAELGLLPASRLLAVSPLYLTSPLGPVDQPDFKCCGCPGDSSRA
jgi:2-amino-4-hydroxy-6-hydroxymethyldihydropteridine diphosphokinase